MFSRRNYRKEPYEIPKGYAVNRVLRNNVMLNEISGDTFLNGFMMDLMRRSEGFSLS